MDDPVTDRDGNSYERAAITEWLTRQQVSPITRNPLQLADLAPNRALRDAIEAWRSGRLHRGAPQPPLPSSSSSSPRLADLTNEQLVDLLRSKNVSERCVEAIRADGYTAQDVFGGGGIDEFVDEAFDHKTCEQHGVKSIHIRTLKRILNELLAAENTAGAAASSAPPIKKAAPLLPVEPQRPAAAAADSSPQLAPPPPRHVDAEKTKKCADCLERLPKSAFSNKQWANGQLGRCTACIAKPAAAAAAAAAADSSPPAPSPASPSQLAPPPPRSSAAAAAVTATALKQCADCHEQLPLAAYSTKQWALAAGARCVPCVSKAQRDAVAKQQQERLEQQRREQERIRWLEQRRLELQRRESAESDARAVFYAAEQRGFDDIVQQRLRLELLERLLALQDQEELDRARIVFAHGRAHVIVAEAGSRAQVDALLQGVLAAEKRKQQEQHDQLDAEAADFAAIRAAEQSEFDQLRMRCAQIEKKRADQLRKFAEARRVMEIAGVARSRDIGTAEASAWHNLSSEFAAEKEILEEFERRIVAEERAAEERAAAAAEAAAAALRASEEQAEKHRQMAGKREMQQQQRIDRERKEEAELQRLNRQLERQASQHQQEEERRREAERQREAAHARTLYSYGYQPQSPSFGYQNSDPYLRPRRNEELLDPREAERLRVQKEVCSGARRCRCCNIVRARRAFDREEYEAAKTGAGICLSCAAEGKREQMRLQREKLRMNDSSELTEEERVFEKVLRWRSHDV